MKYAQLLGNVAASGVRPASSKLDQDASFSAEQLAALNAPFDANAVVCAGAGSGKTRVLAARVCALLKLGANPERVAVVTFTRRAAAEMRARIEALLGGTRRMPVIGTVHALAMGVARRRKLPFALASVEQQLECLAELQEVYPPDCEDLKPEELLLEVSRAREAEEGTPAALLASLYEKALEAKGLGDFTSLLVRATRNPPDRFDHIIVDETQDLSPLQLQLLEGLGPRARFWFIGDPDQSIYSFRGAQSGMMAQLLIENELFFTLTTNYRSARRIVAHANNVIANNPARLELKWQAHREDEGSVATQFFDTGEQEQAFAKAWLEQDPAGRCVLARTRALVDSLRAQGLRALTVHESKGLEWPEVMVLGCEAALFPHPLAGMAEERRLFYVAMTRARDTLLMSSCISRATKNPALAARKPSPFLYEAQALSLKG